MSLDRFTRFQLQSLEWVFLVLFLGGIPLGAVLGGYAMDMLLPTSLHKLLRTIAEMGGGLLGSLLGLAAAMWLGTLVEDGLETTRKWLGLKPLSEIKRESRDREDTASFDREARMRDAFIHMNESEQLYQLLSLLKAQGQQLEALSRTVGWLLLLTVMIAAFLLGRRFFQS